MALIRPSKEQRLEIKKLMVEWARVFRARHGQIDTYAAHRELYAIFSDLGMGGAELSGYRAERPNYEALGMTRKAGEPTDEDRAAYYRVTGGATLPEGSFIVPALFNDTDFIADRYMVKATGALYDLHDRYLGRANDFNHDFLVEQARCRVIGLGVGYDPDTVLRSEVPARALQILNPYDQYAGKYVALTALLAFPKIEGDNTIERVKAGLLKDISIAFRSTAPLCSVCLTQYGEKRPMVETSCFTECEEHGFPGGLTDEGTLVVGIMNSVVDAFTFGIVSDGAIPRACLVLDPTVR